MVSIKDIAAQCGVSVATVSKALNNHNDIGEETKKRVKKIAKEMGYFPNSVARALKTNKTMNIGVLFVEEAHSGITHNYFSYVLDSFKVAAEEKGYDITFLNCNRKRANRMTYLEHSKNRRFDGVVIASINFSDPEVLELIASDLPVITIDYTFNNRSSVISNNVKGMNDLVTYAYEMGHRRIAYIHGMPSSTTNARLSSFYNTLEKFGIEVPEEYVRQVAYKDVEGTAIETENLLQLKEPPTCILFQDDYAAYGGINVINNHNLQIPEDISVAGYDGIALASLIEPNLTTIKQNSTEIGKRAAEKLIAQIEKPKSNIVETIVVDSVLLKGHTMKKIDS